MEGCRKGGTQPSSTEGESCPPGVRPPRTTARAPRAVPSEAGSRGLGEEWRPLDRGGSSRPDHGGSCPSDVCHVCSQSCGARAHSWECDLATPRCRAEYSLGPASASFVAKKTRAVGCRWDAQAGSCLGRDGQASQPPPAAARALHHQVQPSWDADWPRC